MSWIQERLPSRGWVAAIAAPVLLTMSLCFLLQHRPGALAAPLLGPWAGLPLGHHDCTLASQWPVASFVLLGFGALALAGRWRVTNEAACRALSVLLVLWLTIWCAFAVLSVLNTTS